VHDESAKPRPRIPKLGWVLLSVGLLSWGSLLVVLIVGPSGRAGFDSFQVMTALGLFGGLALLGAFLLIAF